MLQSSTGMTSHHVNVQKSQSWTQLPGDATSGGSSSGSIMVKEGGIRVGHGIHEALGCSTTNLKEAMSELQDLENSGKVTEIVTFNPEDNGDHNQKRSFKLAFQLQETVRAKLTEDEGINLEHLRYRVTMIVIEAFKKLKYTVPDIDILGLLPTIVTEEGIFIVSHMAFAFLDQWVNVMSEFAQKFRSEKMYDKILVLKYPDKEQFKQVRLIRQGKAKNDLKRQLRVDWINPMDAMLVYDSDRLTMLQKLADTVAKYSISIMPPENRGYIVENLQKIACPSMHARLIDMVAMEDSGVRTAVVEMAVAYCRNHGIVSGGPKCVSNTMHVFKRKTECLIFLKGVCCQNHAHVVCDSGMGCQMIQMAVMQDGSAYIMQCICIKSSESVESMRKITDNSKKKNFAEIKTPHVTDRNGGTPLWKLFPEIGMPYAQCRFQKEEEGI